MTSKNVKYKTIKGRTKDECIEKLFDLYGNNYKILDVNQKFHDGFWGFIDQRPFFELKYAVLNVDEYEPRIPQQSMNTNPGYQQQVMPRYGQSQGAFNPNINSAVSGQPKSNDSFINAKNEILSKVDPSVLNNVQFKVLSKQLETVITKLDENKNSANPEEHKNILKIQDLLEENEFTSSYIKKIITRLKNELSYDQLDDFELMQKNVVDWIGESIQIDNSKNTKSPRFVVIVGPTGVGKTTTVAKLAATIVLKQNQQPEKIPAKIKLITTDIMRVGAQEQLEHWGEAMNLKVENAQDYDSLKSLCELYSSPSAGFDYIFIDTSGYSPNDFENIGKMRKLLDVSGANQNVYLAFLAGSKARDLENIIRNYETFNFKSVIVTKCDETSTYGAIISVLSERGKSIAWLTTGQNVINTIEKANPLRFLKGLHGFKIDEKHLEEKFQTKKTQII